MNTWICCFEILRASAIIKEPGQQVSGSLSGRARKWFGHLRFENDFVLQNPPMDGALALQRRWKSPNGRAEGATAGGHACRCWLTDTACQRPPEAAALIRDSYLSFPHYDTGDPVGVPEVEGRALAILSGGGKLSCPAPQSRRRENYI